MRNSNNFSFEILVCEVIYNKKIFNLNLVGLKGDKWGMWREAENGRRENGRNEKVKGSGKVEKGIMGEMRKWRKWESGERENVERGGKWKKGEWEK